MPTAAGFSLLALVLSQVEVLGQVLPEPSDVHARANRRSRGVATGLECDFASKREYLGRSETIDFAVVVAVG